MYEFTYAVSFLCILLSNHSLIQFKWMYLTDPMHIHAETIGLSGSSSERHILQTFSSLSRGF